MNLSSDLVSLFAKSTKDEKKVQNEATVYGTVVYDGRTYVKLDGSDLLTPVNTTANVQDGERVTVMIKNHTATVTGNMSSPAARNDDVTELGAQVSQFGTVVAGKVSTEELEAETARIEELVAGKVSTKDFEAETARIEEVVAKKVSTEDFEAETARIGNLVAEKIDADDADLKYATIENLEVTNEKVYNLEGTYGEFEELTSKNFEAIQGTIKNLDSTYANINFANIKDAAFEKIFGDSGIITDLTVKDGVYTGGLIAVEIHGDKIVGGTIQADKLILRNDKNGLYYALNVTEEGDTTLGESYTEEELQNGLLGKVIIAKSITADKISVSDLKAFEATLAGFHVKDIADAEGNVITSALYSGVKNSVDNTTEGIYMDRDGQLAIGDSSSHIKYYKDENGQWHLTVAADEVLFAGGKSVEEVINESTNIQVGAKNLIRNSETLEFENYGFEEAYLSVSYDAYGNVIVDSNAIGASEDGSGNAVLDSGILTAYEDGNGNASLYSEYDVDTAEEANMSTLTVGGYKFNIVSGATKAEMEEMIGALDELYTEDKSTIVAAINEVYMRGGSGTGGGGGGSITYTVTLANRMDSRVMSVPEGETVILKMTYSSVDEDGMDDGAGIGKLLVGGIVRHTFSVNQGDFEVDITQYLATGTNNISIKVTNSEDVTKTMTYTVTLASVSLISSFDASVPYSGAISFPYTPTGLATKTVHFELDGTELPTATVTTSGRQVSYSIPAQSHGAHVLRVWFTCEVSGSTITSNVLYYSIICTVSGNNAPIIAVTTPPVSSVEQYSNVVKKYRVYNPASLTSAITLEANGNIVGSLTVDRTEQTWSYHPTEVGELTQVIRCGNTHVTMVQTVTESSIKVEAETEALALHLSSYGRSNNEAEPGNWESNGIIAEFSNFNFVSDGWVQDEDNITVLRVTGDARLTIPYKIFASDFRTTGKTLEFELATREVLDYDAEVLTCLSNNRGFIITAQQLQMTSQQSTLGSRYKEDEHIRVSIVAERKTENRLLLCYINGILSGAVQYPENDNFAQSDPVGIAIGSNKCTVDLYNIRVYDNSLTRHQILDNWIADTQVVDERIARYRRNEVYDTFGQIVISQLPSDLPYMVLQANELPQFKDDKKTLNGYYVDPLHPERSFTIIDAQIDVQGTSSQYYYVKNYKIKYKNGFILYDGTTAETYQMNSNAVPTAEFTMKADVASSEGAFNVVLAMLYDALCPYKTPAQEADPKVRQCIEGFPIVMFWDNGTETKFIGKYNFNNDKGTPEVFGFKPGDESWEIRQNGTDRVGWHSADFSGDDWKNDFEARYPEDNVDTTRLKALAEWLVSTDTDQATNSSITPVTYNGVVYNTDTKEYRLAKFSAELSDHFIEDAVIFYYLFTEIFLSIDQREKNAFPTYLSDEGKWIVLFYDADSSCGTDNKGNLAFDYYLEDIDYTEGGDPIYNGQNSVLWKNLRETRYDEIAAMYKDLRTRSNNGISYESVIGAFENHQSKWPEAIFNEDMHRKCIEPLIVEGEGMYLPMLQGKKELWMKWWLYNRFRYLDSKYETGTSETNKMIIRAKNKANVSLTSYVNMYGRVYYNSEKVEHRMERDTEQEFVWAASGAEDPVIGITDADMLTSLGDLSPLKVQQISAGMATHITTLKLGDASSSYANYDLTSVSLGNNTLLRVLDVRNCPNLTQSVDISGCTNIEEVYFSGTSTTGVTLPNGGVLKFLHLPGTVTNLTIRNQKNLKTFVMPTYENIETLRLENNSSAIDPFAIFNSIKAKSNVRLIGFSKEMTSDELFAFIDRLDKMKGVDEDDNPVDRAQVSGTIYVPTVDSKTLYAIRTRYPSITVVYNSVITYTVKFYNGDVLLQTLENVMYGSSVEYTGDAPIMKGETDYSRYEFSGWSPDLSFVTGNMDIYAQYTFVGSVARELITRKLSGGYTNDRVSSVGASAFRECTALTSISFPEVVSIGGYSFYKCSKVEHINFPKLESVPGSAFGEFNSLIYMRLPSATTITGLYAISSGKLTTVDLPVMQSIYNAGLLGCSAMTSLILRNTESVCGLWSPNALQSTPIESGTGYVYVPRALVGAYKIATNWTIYANQIRALEDYTVDGTTTGELDETKI